MAARQPLEAILQEPADFDGPDPEVGCGEQDILCGMARFDRDKQKGAIAVFSGSKIKASADNDDTLGAS